MSGDIRPPLLGFWLMRHLCQQTNGLPRGGGVALEMIVRGIRNIVDIVIDLSLTSAINEEYDPAAGELRAGGTA
ncbi:hypothetical protein NLM33_08230 [Bradyrhizobium sp. CCGUVB1N3]|uniref:hypothetical protein n=1 Tax=Bradyrhizobium sp. CCGUVB1N3 TaxID=2949629 RepID=UPI0020B3A00F|nr:hypothetical protein [Bradyrhizobium sp. CCGUVB1N3]MCP3470310.1 hypothetical protein [Bradyrhizobium sp. CCGUVB1N3]